ncbi:uncharacterized protein UTRI_00142_B [Ustilago trichophora]|uniref:Protein BIG1 n=1 Tax=Ustilago trichophora TaxID=86804 RepID=A0A5C3DS03_9BASI|nr:uncharacterized protein UTRI_00142_B [Ustilago trichophora]
MRTTTAVASLLAAAACVSASSSTHPVLAFTSQQANSIQLQAPSDSDLATFVVSLFASGESSPACTLDAIAVVSADKLDRDTFASLRHSSSHSLKGRALDAPSQVTFNAAPESDIANSIAGNATQHCGYSMYRRTDLTPSQKVPDTYFDTKDDQIHFLEIKVDDLRKEESSLLQTLQSLDESHPRNLVIISQDSNGSGNNLHQHTKRQYVAPSSSNGNWTELTGGIFAKYQLFSTPLILTLILVGGVLLPIVYFAVSQLAQVQTPDQMGVRKDPISGDKKTQ